MPDIWEITLVHLVYKFLGLDVRHSQSFSSHVVRGEKLREVRLENVTRWTVKAWEKVTHISY